MSDNITLPREVVKEAADALERSVATCFSEYDHREVLSDPKHFVNQAIEALRTALAAPNENGPRVQPRPVVFSQKNQPSNACKSTPLRGDQQGGEAVSDNITLHKSDCALLLGGYQCTCGLYQRNSKTLPALAAEPQKPSEVGELIENLMHHAYNDGVKQLKYRSSQTVEAEEALRAALAAEQPVAKAWAEGYQQGVKDERTSEASIGIAGFGAKVEPARQNPYGTALAAETPKPEPGLMELARQMKPLDADMAAILHDNLDSLYIEDEPALAAEQPKPEPPKQEALCWFCHGTGYQKNPVYPALVPCPNCKPKEYFK